ncbi:TIGR02444 family protein [Kangiella sp. HZ709]|uniref:TIGR02444 family protein n=1 Tax=Kangiella sp. HZ709 TaxID=2666328 RepID=UPI0018A21A1C|nr:TIGR02444 family protein [Kangiella sp. HZ709]
MMVEKINSIHNDELESWTEEFWQWSCHIYQNQDVAKICIAVQDTLGLNVNYLLLALWCEQKMIPMNQVIWQKIQSESQQAVDAVSYIRAKRLTLKGKSEDAYQQALLIELKAEQQHQKQAIQSLFKQFQGFNRNLASQANMQAYLETNQVNAEDQATVQQLGQLVQNISQI